MLKLVVLVVVSVSVAFSASNPGPEIGQGLDKAGKYGWKDVVREVDIDVDLGKYTLQLATDSVKGAEEEVGIFTKSGVWVSFIGLWFADYSYFVYSCTPYHPSRGRLRLNNVPDDADKIWTFNKTSTSFTITCNDIEVAKVVYADVDKTKFPNCVKYLKQEVKQIRFYSGDTASDRYSNGPAPVGWKDVVRSGLHYDGSYNNHYIDFDLQKHPLQVTTDSVNNYDEINIRLYTESRVLVSTIEVWFDYKDIITYTYLLRGCVPYLFLYNVPDEVNKIWTFTKTSTSLTITCNEVEVGKVVFAYEARVTFAPFLTDCERKLAMDVKMIAFDSGDNASDKYRPGS